jgi:hypothetical protein
VAVVQVVMVQTLVVAVQVVQELLLLDMQTHAQSHLAQA